MTRTFLVAISYDDGLPSDPAADAAEIDEALSNAGLPVESVKPWAAPTLTASILNPFTPAPQTQPPIQ